MPASGHTDPNSLREQIRRWLAENPGQHRPADISTGLGVTGKDARMVVHNEVARLYRNGTLTRTAVTVKGRKRPVTTYALAPASVGGQD